MTLYPYILMEKQPGVARIIGGNIDINSKDEEDEMKKVFMITVVLPGAILFATLSYSASDNCTVVKTEKNQIILNCGKKADQFKVDDKIKIKSVKQKSVEGC
ncbi:hypothetical protein [Desulforhopalus sp. IMCC35007]|uniref:hypothetical protein n=1 Tax=Desulforhopalus sp. IMCC35007 TaxID=2569543 RepID=UPI0010AE638F|nr:hypothetical protein [Desulforhopalus sp. IMCC35007]TKB09347.1 hypothetical protein FCL48_10345 [Desulforhopalus sp. IMCC35007]